MSRTNGRFFLYVLIGLFFGIIDWFYLNWLAHISWGRLGDSFFIIPIIILMNYGIWLIPIIPVVIYEAKIVQKIIFPALAGMLTWMSAIFSYYVYYGILLSLGKLVHLEHLNIFGDKYDAFWYEYWQMFKGIILGQFFEWIIIAIIGGGVIGALAFAIFHKKVNTELRAGKIQNSV